MLTDLEALEHSVALAQIAASPADFAQALTRDGDLIEPWEPYRHLLLLNEKLLDLVDPNHPVDRLLVTMPPQHGKSMLCSLHLPAWYLNRWPAKRIMLCSYADDYSAEWGAKVRDLIVRNPDLLDIRINAKSSAADRWDVEGTAGGAKMAGVGGQITGRGAHLFIIDDPFKDQAEAFSETIRNAKWDWWRATAQSRLRTGSVVVLIQTRWHQDDLAGRILQHEAELWDVINLPAIAEEDDYMGREPGEVLCPELHTLPDMLARQKSVGPDVWASLYQQRPAPEGGGHFRKETFRYWQDRDSDAPTYVLYESNGERILVPKKECGRFVIVDTALSVKTSADFTVLTVWDVAGWLEPPRLILVDRIRTRMEGADHLSLLQDVHERYKATWIGIEETAISMTLIGNAQRAGLPVRKLAYEKDKYGRSETAVQMLNNNRIYFPQKAQWLAEWENELLMFPAGTHDDQVDNLSYAAREFIRGYGIKARPPEKPPATLEEKIWATVRKRGRDTVDPTLGVWH